MIRAGCREFKALGNNGHPHRRETPMAGVGIGSHVVAVDAKHVG